MINPEKLRPMARLGGITYARSTQYVTLLLTLHVHFDGLMMVIY